MPYEKLSEIATDSLRACYAEGKVIASPTYFSDFWARDTFWALPGVLAAGDRTVAKECFQYFLAHQRKDGKIPRKISRDINVLKYLFGKTIKRKKPRPTYHGLVKPFHAMDSELLMIIAFESYLSHTRDYDFAERTYPSLQRALNWHMQRVNKDTGLLHEYFLGNWMDTVFKFGPVLYTNVLYARALEAMSTIAQIAGRDDDAGLYVSHAQKVRRTVRETFWRDDVGHFADESRLTKDTFDLAGNVLAVLYGIVDQGQKKSITGKIAALTEKCGMCLPAVPTGHSFWKINPVVRVMGIADYHTETSWLWIDAMAARLLYENGHEDLAARILSEAEGVALRDTEIGETYVGKEHLPYKKRLWKSASPFAWSSGVILDTLVCTGQMVPAEYEKEEPRIC